MQFFTETEGKYIHTCEFYPQSLREKAMFIGYPQITTVYVPILHNEFQPIVLYGALELFSSSCSIIMKRYSKKNREAIRGLQLSSFSPRKRKSWPGALLASSDRACFWDFSVLQPASCIFIWHCCLCAG